MFVLAFIFIGLAFFGDNMSMSNPGSGAKVMTSHKGSYSEKEFNSLGVSGLSVASNLPSLSLMAQSFQSAPNVGRADAAFFANRIILREEAERLGLVPSLAQIEAKIQAMPEFQNEGRFDQEGYGRFVNKQIGRFGLTEKDFLDLIKDQMSFERITALLTAGVSLDDKFSSTLFDSYMQSLNLDVATLNLDQFIDKADVADDLLKPYWEKQKNKYLSDETRSATVYVFSPKTNEKAAKTGETAAQIPLATQKVGAEVESIWEEVVNKRKGLGIKEVIAERAALPNCPFSLKEEVFSKVKLDELPELLKKSFNPAAGQEGSLGQTLFAMTPYQAAVTGKSEPSLNKEAKGLPSDNISNVLILEDGNVVLFQMECMTEEDIPSPLPFEKARALALADYQEEQATEKLNEAATKLYEAVTNASSQFEAKAKEAGATLTKIDDLSLKNLFNEGVDSMPLFQAARTLNPGQTSKIVVQPAKRSLIHLNKATLQDSPQLAATRANFKAQKKAENSTSILQDWFSTHFRNKGLQFTAGLKTETNY